MKDNILELAGQCKKKTVKLVRPAHQIEATFNSFSGEVHEQTCSRMLRNGSPAFKSNCLYLLDLALSACEKGMQFNCNIRLESRQRFCQRSHIVWRRVVTEREEVALAPRKTWCTKSVLECLSQKTNKQCYFILK